MARKKRGNAAAARAAKARASRSSQQQKQEESKEPVPDDDQTEESMVSDHEESETVQDTAKTTTPPPEEIEDTPIAPPPQPPPESKDDTEEDSQSEKTPPPDPASDPTENKSSTESSAVATDTPAATDEVEDERNYYLNTLLTDKSYLIDVALGYSPEDNLKQPLKCFTTEDELQLFPVIESMSAKLYTIVQKMNACQKKDVEAAMKAKKGIIRMPSVNKACKAFLCQINFMEAPPEPDKPTPTKRTPHPFLVSEDENMFSEEKLKMLLAVLDAGWKREVVMRSPGSTGRKTGDVYYYSPGPNGIKFRSSKQVEKYLAELEDCPFTIENFSFAKVRITMNQDQEVVLKACHSESPPRSTLNPKQVKAPPGMKPESSKSGVKASSSSSKNSPDINEPHKPKDVIQGVSSRRSIQPPKRYSGDAVMLLTKRSKVQEDKRNAEGSNKDLMQMGMVPPLPMMGGAKPRQMIPTVPNLMKNNPFRITVPPPSLSGRTFKKAAPPSHHQSPTHLRLSPGATVVNKQAAIVYATPPQDRSVSLIKRYPQSVCTIGDKKFVVLPKRRVAEYSPVTAVTAVGNGGPPKGIRHPNPKIDGMRQPETTTTGLQIRPTAIESISAKQ